MPDTPAVVTSNEGLLRFSGMYGEAYRDGVFLMDVIEVAGNVAINRIEVPLVGKTKTGYKPGREGREGTLQIQKMDTKWEMEVFAFLSQSLAQRRANRDAGIPNLRPFTLLIEYDDPDALGREKWRLDGVLLWQMPVGFSLGDDLVTREFPMTWESEAPIIAFEAVNGANGVLAPSYFPGAGPG
jgi:hypothetical protein